MGLLTFPGFGIQAGSGGGGGAAGPTHSISIPTGAQTLSHASANWGEWPSKTNTKVATFFCHFKLISNYTAVTLLWSTGSHDLRYNSAGTFSLKWRINSTNYTGTTTNTWTDTDTWHTITCICDTTAASNNDRMKIYIDGVDQGFASHPTITQNTTLNITAADGQLGHGGVAYNGLIYNAAFFDAAVADADLHNSGSPKDLSAVSGLHSYLNCVGGDITKDAILPNDWTKSGTMSASTDIPT